MLPPTDQGSPNATATTKLPGHLQVRYAQQNIGPYRRCSVEVARSVVAAAGERLLRLVDFFLQPVRERSAKAPPPEQEQPRCVRLMCVLRLFLQSTADWPGFSLCQCRYMDVEVRLEETLACLLEEYRRPPPAALFALLRFEYLHKWRGFTEVIGAGWLADHARKQTGWSLHIFINDAHILYILSQGGPGTVDATIALALQNVFFSRQGLVLDRCLPLTTPFEFRLQLLTDIFKAQGGRPADRHRYVNRQCLSYVCVSLASRESVHSNAHVTKKHTRRSLILNLRDLGDGCPTAAAHEFRAMSLVDAPSSSPASSSLPHSSSSFSSSPSSVGGGGSGGKGPEIHAFLSVPDGRLFLKV